MDILKFVGPPALGAISVAKLIIGQWFLNLLLKFALLFELLNTKYQKMELIQVNLCQAFLMTFYQ